MRISILLFFLTCANIVYGYQQPQELYNEGLMHYQQGNIGLASQSLKKALILKPSLKEARILYNTVQNEIGGIESATGSGTILLLTVLNIFPPQVDSLLSALLFLLASVLSGLIILKKIVKKRYLNVILALLYVSSSILLIQAGIKYITFSKDIRVAIFPVDILDQPFEDGQTISSFPAGSEFEAIEENNGYVFVRSLEKQEGWANTNNIPKLWGNS
ncbi:MAG: hypothetical protein ACRCY4_09245 [Brevinema sp.]